MSVTKLVATSPCMVEGKTFIPGDVVATLDSHASPHTVLNFLGAGRLSVEAEDYEAPVEKDEAVEETETEVETTDEETEVETTDEETETPNTSALTDAGLSEKVASILGENSETLSEPRLLSPEGVQSWIDEGNDLVDLDDVGTKTAAVIQTALGLS